MDFLYFATSPNVFAGDAANDKVNLWPLLLLGLQKTAGISRLLTEEMAGSVSIWWRVWFPNMFSTMYFEIVRQTIDRKLFYLFLVM